MITKFLIPTLILASLLMMTACTSSADTLSPQEAASYPTAKPIATSLSPEPTKALETTESTESEVNHKYQPCEMLDPDELSAMGFSEFEVGEGAPGTDVPLALGKAQSCRWEIGNPNAQFHHRIYLYIFDYAPGETPEEAYDAQSRRMSRAVEITDICDQAEYNESNRNMLCLDGDLLFYLKADLPDSSMDVHMTLISLARMILEHK